MKKFYSITLCCLVALSAGADGNGVSLSAPAAPGLYIVRGVTDKGAAVSRRLLVK